MNVRKMKMLRPDAKGRVCLGILAKGVEGFSVMQDDENRIILIPHVLIPAKEKWLFENKTALSKVKRGLKESSAGKVRRMGSFNKYIDDKVE